MKREEALKNLNTLYMALAEFPNQQISLGDVDKMKESVSMAIKALEQEPCEDAISRQAVIKHICEEKFCYEENCKGVLFNRCPDITWVNELPPVTPQSKTGYWIPVSEQLPDKREWYLAVFKETDTGYQLILPRVADYIGNGENVWRIIDEDGLGQEYCSILECVAWMPLPEPYKAKSEEDNAKSEVEVCSSNFIQLKQDVLNNKQLWRKLREIEDEQG